MSNHLLIFVLLVGVAYGGLEAWPLIKGPGIELYSPLQNATYQDGTVTVKGVAKRVSGLSLNGAPLFYEENGNFEVVLTFPRGGTILTLAGTDRFGRSKTITRTIFVPASTTQSLINKN